MVVANAVVRAVASGLEKKSRDGWSGLGCGVLAVEEEEDGRMNGGEDMVAMGIVEIGGCGFVYIVSL